ncbi:unnamed protein product [Ilex paraguariensis]|uniref:Protein kinase domain-containing protein n=1 Tax=Ilex paraguariensis TaxID=185542 RepID=A0ABC8R5F0_9AQUA
MITPMKWVRGETVGQESFSTVNLAIPTSQNPQIPPLMAMKSCDVSHFPQITAISSLKISFYFLQDGHEEVAKIADFGLAKKARAKKENNLGCELREMTLYMLTALVRHCSEGCGWDDSWEQFLFGWRRRRIKVEEFSGLIFGEIVSVLNGCRKTMSLQDRGKISLTMSFVAVCWTVHFGQKRCHSTK